MYQPVARNRRPGITNPARRGRARPASCSGTSRRGGSCRRWRRCRATCSTLYTPDRASQVASDIDEVECNSSAASSNDLSSALPAIGRRSFLDAFDLGVRQPALTCDQHVLAPLVPALAVPTRPQDQQLAFPRRQGVLRQDVGGEHQPPAQQIGMVGERAEDVEHLAIRSAHPAANNSARRGSSVSRRTASRGGGVLMHHPRTSTVRRTCGP